MNKVILMTVFALTACSSNEASVKVASKCPEHLVKQRDQALKLAEITVVGRWKPAEPNPAPGVGVEIGTISVSKIVRGELSPDALVGIVTGEIADPAGTIVRCALSEPSPIEDRIFYIMRSENSLQIIDHRPNVES